MNHADVQRSLCKWSGPVFPRAASRVIALSSYVFLNACITAAVRHARSYSRSDSNHHPDSFKTVPLNGPSPGGNALHRVTVAETMKPRSVLVTGLLSSEVFRIFGGGV